MLPGLPVVEDEPQDVIPGLHANPHEKLCLNALRQFLFDNVACDVGLVQPFTIRATDPADEKQFVSLPGPVQVLRVETDQIRHFQPLINTQMRLTQPQIPWNFRLLARIDPIGYRNRFEIERNSIANLNRPRRKRAGRGEANEQADGPAHTHSVRRGGRGCGFEEIGKCSDAAVSADHRVHPEIELLYRL